MKSKIKIISAMAISIVVVIGVVIMISALNRKDIDLSNNKFESFEVQATTEVEISEESSNVLSPEEYEEITNVETTIEETTIAESKEITYANLEIQRLSPTGGYDTIIINEKAFEDYDSFISNVFNPNIIACEDGLDNLSGMVLNDYTVDSSSYVNNDELISVKFNTTQNFPGVFIYNKKDKTIGVFYE